MSKVYCGALKVPKGSKEGTVRQCIRMQQVRLYGLKPVEKPLLKMTKKYYKYTSEKDAPNSDVIFTRIGALRSKVKKWKERYEKNPIPEIKEHWKEEKAKLKEYIELFNKYKKIEQEKKEKRAAEKAAKKVKEGKKKVSRQTVRKPSKKPSAKKTSKK